MIHRLLVVLLLLSLTTTPAIAQQEKAVKPAKVRAWETLSEVIKAANAADAFTGEDHRSYASRAVATLAIARSVLEKRKERA